MLKNPVFAIIAIAFIVMSLLSSCTSTPQTQPKNDIRIISAKAIGYAGNNAKILSAYQFEDDPEGKIVMLGTGRIKANGEFTFEHKKSIPDEDLYPVTFEPPCKLTYSNTAAAVTTPSSLSIVNSKNKLLGRLYLSTSENLESIGKTADYVFVNQDGSVKGKCRDTSNSNPLVVNHNAQFKAGWNILITHRKTENLWEIYTSTDISDLKWHYLPSRRND